jgi:hypothetical protein
VIVAVSAVVGALLVLVSVLFAIVYTLRGNDRELAERYRAQRADLNHMRKALVDAQAKLDVVGTESVTLKGLEARVVKAENTLDKLTIKEAWK